MSEKVKPMLEEKIDGLWFVCAPVGYYVALIYSHKADEPMEDIGIVVRKKEASE